MGQGEVEIAPRRRLAARERDPCGHGGVGSRARARRREGVFSLCRGCGSSSSVSSTRPSSSRCIEADTLGQLRTGAASGVAARHLAKAGRAVARCHRLRVSGGDSGGVHPRRAAGARARRRLLPNAGAARGLLQRVGAEPAESHQEAAEQDVVVTITSSRDPVLRGEWLRPALSSSPPVRITRAAESSTTSSSSVRRSSAATGSSRRGVESGDLIEPVAAGTLDWLEVHELHEVVTRRGAGPTVRRRTSSSSSRTASPRGTSRSEPRRCAAPSSGVSGRRL